MVEWRTKGGGMRGSDFRFLVKPKMCLELSSTQGEGFVNKKSTHTDLFIREMLGDHDGVV